MIQHPRPRRSRVTRALPATVAVILAVPTVSLAHDFWLVPSAFALATGELLEIRGQTSSSFPTSESAVAVDRVAEARLLSATADVAIRDLSTSGTSLVLRYRPSVAGQYLVAATLRPRSVRESAAGFRRYLELEGAPEAAARYEREGKLPTRDSVTRRYAKYAKTLVQVGRGGAPAFARTVGQPLEFVPLSDPLALRTGDTLRVRLLYRGQPLAGARVHAGSAPVAGAAAREQSPTTDGEGVAAIALTSGSLWNVRAIHVTPATVGSGADWDAHWASLVFSTSAGGRSGQHGATDSADVAGVVQRFHRAIETGDSLAAMAMLAADAEVLESGGVEDRAEFRAHHLAADIAFAQAVRQVRGALRVKVQGDVAWTSATSTSTGTFRGRPIDSSGAESMVLARGADGRWLIRSIHWSSRSRRPANPGARP